MDPSSIVSVIVAVLSAFGVVIANRYTARTAREAQNTTASTELAKLDQVRIDSWRADNEELRKQRREDKELYDESMKELKDRVTMLEVDQQIATRERKLIVSWARRVVDVFTSNQILFPPPPVGLIDTDPNIPRIP